MLGDAAAGRWPVPASAVGTPSAATTSAAAMRIFFTFSPYVVVCVSWYVSRYCTVLVQLLSKVYPSSCVPLQRREAPTARVYGNKRQWEEADAVRAEEPE